MFIDWIHWLSSHSRDELLWLLAPVLLFDVTRYSCGFVVLFWCDFLCLALAGRSIGQQDARRHCPSICVVVAGLNEADTVVHTLASLCGTYPRMETIVVDDGSVDGMARVANGFARQHAEVRVLRKPCRGGKSSALNFALPFTQAEILVCVDADSQLGPDALWEIVQPFSDPRVGATSGTVLARHPFTNLLTWMQAFEYLRCIFVGRRVAARVDMLGIISGAFGAYRRDALQQQGGWDVGPGEDGDLTLRLRKSGYRIAFAPDAQCLTNVPTQWMRLLRQRRRWEWAVVTFECRKHVDMANPLSANFRLSNLAVLLERWTYNILFTYVLWLYALWTVLHFHDHTWKQYFLYYLAYLVLELVNLGVILFYSTDRKRDAWIGLVAPLMPLYNVLLRAVTLVSVTEELLTRRSFRDNFVPVHVREATWHW